ncbi:hypothetical protein TcasGA2_TC032917 [Tribolium castaneum]|uniref:Uncharacterized protein n=1 Tax=Tribolium castaneum TaxID=7070 RepID=A0A139WJT7_TRICA|nr:hypothetical protein TcasGA2_TC032917 [Tribolium castaneum]
MKFFGVALFFCLLVAASFAIPAELLEPKAEGDGGFSPRQRRLPPYCGWGKEPCY